VRFYLDHIFVNKLGVLNRKTSHCINHINLAVVIVVGNIIEENVLGAIVSLIDEKRFST